jgi:hypothetical protein
MNLYSARVVGAQPGNLELEMLPARHREKVSGFIVTALVLALLSAPAAYAPPNNMSLLGSAIDTSSVPEAGFTVAIPVSGVQEPAVNSSKPGQIHKKHAGT